MIRRSHHRRRGEIGQSMLETGMMIVVIFMVTFWIVEMCNVMYTYNVMADAANEGVRYGIITPGIAAGDSNVVDRVKLFAGTSLHKTNAISVSVTLPDGDSKPPHRLRVTVTYTYVPWLQGFITPPTMHTYAEGRMVAQ